MRLLLSRRCAHASARDMRPPAPDTRPGPAGAEFTSDGSSGPPARRARPARSWRVGDPSRGSARRQEGRVAVKVLVSAASRHGATVEMAANIGAALQAAGHDAFVLAPDEVQRVDGYDAAVIGSGVYVGRWLEPAKDLLARHKVAAVGDPGLALLQRADRRSAQAGRGTRGRRAARGPGRSARAPDVPGNGGQEAPGVRREGDDGSRPRARGRLPAVGPGRGMGPRDRRGA